MVKSYVIDTNVLIQAPYALQCFEDNQVILPLVVLEELDGLKKSEGERGAAGWGGRQNRQSGGRRRDRCAALPVGAGYIGTGTQFVMTGESAAPAENQEGIWLTAKHNSNSTNLQRIWG